MISGLSLRTKFTMIAMVLVVTAIISAITNYRSFESVSQEADLVEIASQLLRNHMDGDMMHDAIRADILKVTLAVKAKDIKMAQEVQAELQDHGSRFLENLKKNKDLNIPQEMKSLLENETPLLENYNAKAGKYIETAVLDINSGTENALTLLPDFNKSFDELEDQQEKLGKEILAYLSSLKDEQLKFTMQARSQTLIAAFVTIVFSIALPVLSQFLLFQPLSTLIDANKALAEGNLDTQVPFDTRKDEIGELAHTLKVFRTSAVEKKMMEKQQEDLERKAEEEKKKAMHVMAETFQTEVMSTITSLNEASSGLQKMAGTMSLAADESMKRSESVTDTSRQATANVQTVASATEELSASVHEIQTRVDQSNVMVQQAAQQAILTNTKVQSLTDAASKIGAVVEIITDIASQTNLLALNATIEAARAGEAGKGFAVVASEVKNLAAQTAKATEEIAQQVKNIQDETQASVEAISQITKAIEEVSQTSSAIAAAVSEQRAATQEIARNVSEAAQGTSMVSASISSVNDSSKEVGATARQVLASANGVSKNGSDLKHHVDIFLKRLRGN